MARRGAEAGMTEKWGGRYLVQRFAAHLAHLLNTGDEFIEINNFALYRTLIRTLAGPPDATGGRYRDGLLGYALVAGEREPEELAERYFETVLDRGMPPRTTFISSLCRRMRLDRSVCGEKPPPLPSPLAPPRKKPAKLKACSLPFRG